MLTIYVLSLIAASPIGVGAIPPLVVLIAFTFA
ncbi:Uncharacterised protein [Morganella morganii]|nr:Uncharacterised protein [Morganella morganii]